MPAAGGSRTAARSSKSSASTATAGCARPSSCPPASCILRAKLGFDQFALVETLAIGCHAVNRGAPVAFGESCLVIGAGPIGLATLEFVKLSGARTIVLDMNERRLDFCRDVMGAEHHDQAVRLGGGRPPRRHRRPPARRRDRRHRARAASMSSRFGRGRSGRRSAGLRGDHDGRGQVQAPGVPPARGDAALLAERPAGRLHADHRPDRRGADRHDPLDHAPVGLRRACPRSSRRIPGPRRASSRRWSRWIDHGRAEALPKPARSPFGLSPWG